jgi:hypothetical protein
VRCFSPLLRAGVESHHLVAATTGGVLEPHEQPAGVPLPARLGDDEHALDLGGAVVEALHAAAADRHPGAVPADEQLAVRSPEVVRRRRRGAGAVDAAVERLEVEDHALEELARR